jgi:predicted phosphoribosyltransferase
VFEALSGKFQLKFKDRAAAGIIMAEILKDTLKKEKSGQCILVLGVPRGGVVTADSVARSYQADHSNLLILTLLYPEN